MVATKCIGCGRSVNAQMIACPDCSKPVGYSGGTQVEREKLRGNDQPDKEQHRFKINEEGVRLLHAGKYDEAVSKFTQVINMYPNFIAAYRNRGQAYECLNKRVEAQADFNRADSFMRMSKRRAESGDQELPIGKDDETNYESKMGFGLLWVIGGVIATGISYNIAGPGGTYFLFWGAILFGGIEFLWGLIGWLTRR